MAALHVTAIAAALFIALPSPLNAQEKTNEAARDGTSSAAPGNADTPVPPSVVKGQESGPKGPKGEGGVHSAAETKAYRIKQESEGRAKIGPKKGSEGAHSETTTKMERNKQESEGQAKIGPKKGSEGTHSAAETKAYRVKQESEGRAKLGPKKGADGAHSAAETKAHRVKQESEGRAKFGPKKGADGVHSTAETSAARAKPPSPTKVVRPDVGAHNVASSKAQQLKSMPTRPMPEPKAPKL